MTPEQREALATVLAHYGSDPCVRPLRVLRDQDDEVQELYAALADACDLLEGWIGTKCPARYRAEHMAHVQKLRRHCGPNVF